ncbi:MAG: hypothetical protein QOK43_2882 [Acidimicrobiaceae bacterium]|nr:hypothetical protein [Acidimicrobiaceae bacterium]
MSDQNSFPDVPLALWQLAPEGATEDQACGRSGLAQHIVDSYSAPGDVVLDLAPTGSDVALAAVRARRTPVVVVTTPGLGGAWPEAGLEGFDGHVALGVVLPPEPCFRTGRAFAPPRDAFVATVKQAAALLRPGGHLVVGFLGRGEALGTAVDLAAAGGLHYVQHVVALLADGGERGPVRHADVLVFGGGRP